MCLGRIGRLPGGSLRILTPGRADQGLYTCTASNHVGTTSRSSLLQIAGSSVPPPHTPPPTPVRNICHFPPESLNTEHLQTPCFPVPGCWMARRRQMSKKNTEAATAAVSKAQTDLSLLAEYPAKTSRCLPPRHADKRPRKFCSVVSAVVSPVGFYLVAFCGVATRTIKKLNGAICLRLRLGGSSSPTFGAEEEFARDSLTTCLCCCYLRMPDSVLSVPTDISFTLTLPSTSTLSLHLFIMNSFIALCCFPSFPILSIPICPP